MRPVDARQMTQSSDITSQLSSRIATVRGKRVLIDSDLAALYGVSTMRFNEAVKRNQDRFPDDFVFTLTNQEVAILKSQFAISSLGAFAHGGRRKPPRAFTEHGAIMATILNSPRAAQMSIYVVRAFVEMRQLAASNATTLRRLEALERSVAALDSETRKQFDQVHEAILGLMVPTSRRN